MLLSTTILRGTARRVVTTRAAAALSTMADGGGGTTGTTASSKSKNKQTTNDLMGKKKHFASIELPPQSSTTTHETAVNTKNAKTPPPHGGDPNLPCPPQATEKRLHERGILDSRNLLNFTTLHDMQRNACEAFASHELFGTFNPTNESYEWMTFEQFNHRVSLSRSVLKEDMGIVPYDKIGIISNNRWEWAAIATAAYSLNATLVPMYEAQLPSDWSYILNDAGCKAVFCATEEIHHQVDLEVLPHVPTLQGSLCLDAPLGHEYGFTTAMDRAEQQRGGGTTGVIEPTPDDLANLVYTSGTTGKPKGVELLHSNFCSNVKAVRTMVDNPHDFIRYNDRSLAFLPWAHSYGQTCELWMALAHGGSMGVCRGVTHILEDLQLVQPTQLFSVPTLYKRVYDGVHNMMESSSPVKKTLMRQALHLGRANTIAKEEGSSLGFVKQIQFNLLDKIILSKIRNRFGGNLRHGFVAGAACPREILDFMDDLGIPIYEGYGLTETSPIISLNAPGNRKVGSVGRGVTGVTALIVDERGQEVARGAEGEICCYGPNVMKGYYGKKEATDEVISLAPDGESRMFHTGDMGRMDEEGYISITGRIKEQYKLENGKYVVPTPIEESIGMSRFVRQVVVCGANRPHNVALLVAEWDAIRQELDIDDDVPEEELVNDKRVRRLLNAEIESTCVKLKKFEVPTSWAIVAPFTAQNNMLTPKMSVRRHMVVRAYEDVIQQLYEADDDEDEYEQE